MDICLTQLPAGETNPLTKREIPFLWGKICRKNRRWSPAVHLYCFRLAKASTGGGKLCRIASLEQVRAIFDASEVGIILIGMPGLEKRLARYAQFSSRIGFVHEYRPLGATEIRRLLAQRWSPAAGRGHYPRHKWQFPVAESLLTQIERIPEINSLEAVNKAVVETARESLVIGQA